MTILVGAIRDSSHSGDSSSHIEKMRSTSRASVRERKSNQRKKRKNKWKRIRQGGPKYSKNKNVKFSYKIFQSCLEILSVYVLQSFFWRVLGNLQILERKLTLVCPPFSSALILKVICWLILKVLNKPSNSHPRVTFSVYLDKF